MSSHALSRTSPKGEPFIGTCLKCGQQELNLLDAQKECPNTRNLSEDQTLLLAVKGDGRGD